MIHAAKSFKVLEKPCKDIEAALKKTNDPKNTEELILNTVMKINKKTNFISAKMLDLVVQEIEHNGYNPFKKANEYLVGF